MLVSFERKQRKIKLERWKTQLIRYVMNVVSKFQFIVELNAKIGYRRSLSYDAVRNGECGTFLR